MPLQMSMDEWCLELVQVLKWSVRQKKMYILMHYCCAPNTLGVALLCGFSKHPLLSPQIDFASCGVLHSIFVALEVELVLLAFSARSL